MGGVEKRELQGLAPASLDSGFSASQPQPWTTPGSWLDRQQEGTLQAAGQGALGLARGSRNLPRAQSQPSAQTEVTATAPRGAGGGDVLGSAA